MALPNIPQASPLYRFSSHTPLNQVNAQQLSAQFSAQLGVTSSGNVIVDFFNALKKGFSGGTPRFHSNAPTQSIQSQPIKTRISRPSPSAGAYFK